MKAQMTPDLHSQYNLFFSFSLCKKNPSHHLAISPSRYFHYFKAVYSALISFILTSFGLAFTLA